MRPDIEMKFGEYRVAKVEQVVIMNTMQKMFLNLARYIDKNCPDNDMKGDAINMLLKCKMMSNASLMANTDFQTEIG